jgi:hypothetical protein
MKRQFRVWTAFVLAVCVTEALLLLAGEARMTRALASAASEDPQPILEWRNPPAAEPVADNVRALQWEPTTASSEYVTLSIQGATKLPSDKYIVT